MSRQGLTLLGLVGSIPTRHPGSAGKTLPLLLECSSTPDCLTKHEAVAGFTMQLLSQHQMTKKNPEGKYEQGKPLSVFSCAARC